MTVMPSYIETGSLTFGMENCPDISTAFVAAVYESNDIYVNTDEPVRGDARLQISSGSSLVISAGESSSAIDVLFGGRVHLQGENAVATDVVVSSGGTVFVSEGGLLSNASFVSGAKLRVSSGGTTSQLTITGNQVTISGGTCVDDVLSSGGVQDVFSDGVVLRTVVSSAGKILLAGGTALSAVVKNDGSLYVRSYGSDLSYASNVQISSGGFMDVYSSSVAEGTIVHSSGVLHVWGNGVLNNTLIESNGRMDVYSLGTASGTLIEFGGRMDVQSASGLAIDTVVSGFARVYDNALMSRTTIASGASFHVWKSGVLKDAEVQYGGLLDMRESAPVLSGDILVAGQLKATIGHDVNASGANIILDLTSRTASDTYSIVNLDYFGETTLAITVSSNQSAGIYKLASNAGSWDSPIALTVQGDDAIHELPLGVVYSGIGKNYVLGKGSNGDIVLSVSNADNGEISDYVLMVPFSESGSLHLGPALKSTFEMEYKGGSKKVTVAGVSNLTVSDWFLSDVYPTFRNPKVVDGNKSIVAYWDNYWCESYTKANVLTWTGIAALAGYADEDDLFKQYLNDKIEFGETPFFNAYPELGQHWKTRFTRFNNKDVSTHNLTGMSYAASLLSTGQYVGYLQFTRGEIGNVTGSHAVTIYGFVTDESKSVDDNDYYCGVVIADNNYNGKFSLSENSEKELRIVGIHWDSDNEIYCLEDDYKGFFTFIELYQVLEQPGAADLIWYRPNEWKSALTIGTNTSSEADIIYDNDEVFVSFAVTNQGMVTANSFFVSLFVDNELTQAFKVDSLEKDKISACLNYSIGNLDTGSHSIRIVIDSEDNVAESYEQNNVFTRTVEVHHSGDVIVVSSGAEQLIHSQTQAVITVESGGWCQVVGSNTCLASAVVSSGGSLVCYSGNSLCSTTLSGARVSIGDGVTAEQTILLDGACLVLQSGGVTSRTLVSSNSYEDVFFEGITSSAVILSGGRILLAGGTALDTVVSTGGGLYVRSYGSDLSYASGAQIYSGGFMDVYDSSLVEGTVIHSNGYVRVRDYGIASDTLIEYGASMYVHSVSGYAIDTVVSGFARVYDNALMSRTTLASGASFHVWKSGVLKDAEVQYGALLDMRESAPVLSGDILVAGQLRAYSNNQNINVSNANIIVDLSQRGTQDDYSIINWDWLRATTFNVSVTADQAEGTYKLASKASSFDQSISLKVAGTSDTLRLTVGHLAETATATYTLARGEDNALTLAVGKVNQIDDTNYPVMSAYTETGHLTFGMGNLSEITFNDGAISSGFVCCIGGLTLDDWTVTGEAGKPYIIVHNKILDAEKSDNNTLDDYWCGEMTETNMLEWTGHVNRCGWQSGDHFMAYCISQGLAAGDDWEMIDPRRKIFEIVDNPWSVHWGGFDRTGLRNTWLQQADAQLRSGNYIGWWQVFWGTPDNITGNHAMTLLGFTYDTRYSPDDPRYYSGVIIADSDDNKWTYDNAAFAPNLIKVEPIVWDDSIGSYLFRNGDGFMDNIWTIQKLPTPATADLTWYQPNAWTMPMTVNTCQNALYDEAILRSNEELLLNFAVTNTGMADSGKFHVALYVDNELQETFKVSSLEYNGIAAFQNYSLGTLSVGTHVISAVIDSDDNVTEGYETNNIYSKTINVIAPNARLQVSSACGFIISTGETADAFDVHSGAHVHLRGESAVATDVVVTFHGKLFVSSGAQLSNAAITSGGNLYVYSGGTAIKSLLQSSSHMDVYTGGLTLSAVVHENAALAVSTGGIASKTAVSSGGTEAIFSGGTALATVVSSGGRLSLVGGVASGAVINSGGSELVRLYNGTPSHDYNALIDGGLQRVYSSNGGFAHGATIKNGGCQSVYTGGVVYDTVVFGGCLMVNTDGSAYDATILSGGTIRIHSDGGVSNAIVSSGGSMYLSSGAVLQGTIQLAGYMNLRDPINATAATVNLDLSQRTTDDGVLISDFVRLGSTNLVLTVGSDQTEGVYKLASNASSFNQTVTVVCADGTSGVLSKGNTFKCGDYSFQLNVYSSSLIVAVKALDKQPPVLASISADVTGPVNHDVTVTASFTDNVGVAYQQYRLAGEPEWTTADGVIVENNTTVYFRAFDAEGNVSEIASYSVTNIDRMAPVISNIHANVTAPTKNTVTVIAQASDDVNSVTLYYSQDGGAYRAYTNGVVFTSNGTVVFKAIDAAGNETISDVFTVGNIDRAAPEIFNIHADVTAPTNGAVVVTAEARDDAGVVTLYYSQNGGTFRTYTNGVRFTANGTVVFKAIDGVGNETLSEVFTVGNIDKAVPVITLTGENETPCQATTLTATAEAGLDIYVSTDNATWTLYTAPLAITANGMWYFKATDVAGNTGYAQRAFANIDTTAPIISNIHTDITTLTNGTVVVTAEASDANAVSLFYSQDGGEYVAYTDGVRFTANGTVVFKAVDAAGNETVSDAFTVENIDNAAPVIRLAAYNTKPRRKSPIIATTEAGLDIYYSTDNATWTLYTEPLEVTSNGTWYFKATDAAGNTGFNSITFNNIDSIPPVIELVGNNETPHRAATLTASTEAGLDIYFSTDNATWSLYTSTLDITANGTWYFKATDSVGNTGYAEMAFTNIDTIAPIFTSITADITAPTNGAVVVTAEASDANAVSLFYSQDGGEYVAYTDGVRFTANGTVVFKAIDAAGNEIVSDAFTVENIDNAAPVIRLAAYNTKPRKNSPLIATTEAGVDIFFSMDNATWTLYTEPLEVTSNGTWYFKATDAAGNTGTSSITFSNIDSIPPVIELVGDNETPLQASTLTASTEAGLDIYFSTDNATWSLYMSPLDITANGTWYFKATDSVGNTGYAEMAFTNIDTTAPAVELAGDNTSPLRAATLTATTELGLDIYVSEDNATWSLYTVPLAITANGTWYFKATDAAGNTGYAEMAFTNIDTTPPVFTSITADVTAPTNGTVVVTAEASDANTVTLLYSQDNGEYVAYTNGVTFTANGTVRFKAIDAASNETLSEVFTVANIDKVAPTSPVATASTTEPTNGDVTVTAVFSDDSVVRMYSLDGETWQDYTEPVVFTSNGTVYFRSIDEAQNASDITAFTVDNIDKVAPTAPVATASTTEPTNGDVTVTAVFSDDSVVRMYSLDGETWQDYTEPVVFTSNGTVYFRSIDEAQNASDITAFIVDNIDKVAPTAPVVTASTSESTNEDVTVTAVFSDDSVTKQYSLDGETWQDYTEPVVFTANGTILFKAIDVAGNETIGDVFTVGNIDTTAPVITLTGDNANPLQATTLTATTEPDLDIYYSTDNATWMLYTAPLDVTANGTWFFKATDTAGNTGFNSITFSNIDSDAPVIELTGDNTTPLQTSTLTAVTATGLDIFFSTDYITWTKYEGTLSIIAKGTWYFKATDAAGNTGYAQMEFTNIDTIAPAIELAGDNATPLQAATLTATTEPDLDIYYSTDNETWMLYTASLSITANGTWCFKATDAAGNTGSNSITFNNIDTTAPVISNIRADVTAPTNGMVVVTAEASDANAVTLFYSQDGGEFTAYVDGVRFTANGMVVFKAIDAAENEAVSDVFTVGNIDTTAPVITLTGDNTTPLLAATLTATTEPELDIYVSTDNDTWMLYTGTLDITANGTWYFKTTDVAGNIGYAQMAFANIYTLVTVVTEVEVQTDTNGGTAVIDWSSDATAEWVRVYDVALNIGNGLVELSVLDASGIELQNAPTGEHTIAVKPHQADVWSEDIALATQNDASDAPTVYTAGTNGLAEVMFATAHGVWNDPYQARYVGTGDWTGKEALLPLVGRNRIDDLFAGSNDTTILLLTDDAHGDALFVDDVFSAFPNGMDAQARLAKIDEIRAGAGNDLVDLTSQRYGFTNTVTVYGGDGDDVLWAGQGACQLFGDAGNDLLVGSDSDDLLVGGSGNDELYGGGGNDLFAFGGNWGNDTVEQLDGQVTLVFDHGSMDNWDASTLTYTDDENSVTVMGVASSDDVTLLFGNKCAQYDTLLANGAFSEFTSHNIFKDKGMLA